MHKFKENYNKTNKTFDRKTVKNKQKHSYITIAIE